MSDDVDKYLDFTIVFTSVAVGIQSCIETYRSCALPCLMFSKKRKMLLLQPRRLSFYFQLLFFGPNASEIHCNLHISIMLLLATTT